MAEITIEHSTFERLQRHAKPLVDTTDSVLNRALDALEKQIGPSVKVETSATSERRIDPRRLPKLTHTKVLEATIDQERIAKPNWNRLLDRILIESMRRLQDFRKLHQLCPVNMVEGRKEDEGYGYLTEIDISVQGQDANAACRTIVAAAQGLNIELDIAFMWRPKNGAEYPGEHAHLMIGSNSH